MKSIKKVKTLKKDIYKDAKISDGSAKKTVQERKRNVIELDDNKSEYQTNPNHTKGGAKKYLKKESKKVEIVRIRNLKQEFSGKK